MATVASPPRPVGAAPPTVRHGICRLTLRIGATEYRLRPMPAPAGFRAVWTLRKIDPGGEVVYSVAQAKGEPPACTCPDHEYNKSVCKHIMAIAALGLIPRPKAARPPKARTRQIHAANARQAIAEAKSLPVEARRHLAEIAPSLPEGWQPGGAHPSFASGFRQAVAAHVGRLNGTAAPEVSEWSICEGCGREFDPEISRDPSFCESCMSEGGAA